MGLEGILFIPLLQSHQFLHLLTSRPGQTLHSHSDYSEVPRKGLDLGSPFSPLLTLGVSPSTPLNSQASALAQTLLSRPMYHGPDTCPGYLQLFSQWTCPKISPSIPLPLISYFSVWEQLPPGHPATNMGTILRLPSPAKPNQQV